MITAWPKCACGYPRVKPQLVLCTHSCMQAAERGFSGDPSLLCHNIKATSMRNAHVGRTCLGAVDAAQHRMAGDDGLTHARGLLNEADNKTQQLSATSHTQNSNSTVEMCRSACRREVLLSASVPALQVTLTGLREAAC